MQSPTVAEQISELERLRARLLVLLESRRKCPRCGSEDRQVFGTEYTCRDCQTMWRLA